MGDSQRKAELYEQFARVGKALASPKLPTPGPPRQGRPRQ